MTNNKSLSSCILLGFPDSNAQAASLAVKLGMQYDTVSIRRFPDGETYLRLPEKLPEHVIFFNTLNSANDKLIELMLASTTAKRQGAKRVSLVAPYLCYMRQDHIFHPGEAESQSIVGDFMKQHFDDLITVDPHLHRTHDLSLAMPVKNAQALTASKLISDFIKNNLDTRPLLLGPDAESLQWVKQVAAPESLDYSIATKTRYGDRDVKVEIPLVDVQHRDIVIVDDIGSTGNTLIQAAEQVKDKNIGHMYAVVTHALLNQQALNALKESGIEKIWSTNTLPHSSNVIDIEPVLVEGIEQHLLTPTNTHDDSHIKLA